MNIDFTVAKWLNKPKLSEISKQSVKITTEPNTDFWQGTYYGFRNDNAHSLLLQNDINFSFTAWVKHQLKWEALILRHQQRSLLGLACMHAAL